MDRMIFEGHRLLSVYMFLTLHKITMDDVESARSTEKSYSCLPVIRIAAIVVR